MFSRQNCSPGIEYNRKELPSQCYIRHHHPCTGLKLIELYSWEKDEHHKLQEDNYVGLCIEISFSV